MSFPSQNQKKKGQLATSAKLAPGGILSPPSASYPNSAGNLRVLPDGVQVPPGSEHLEAWLAPSICYGPPSTESLEEWCRMALALCRQAVAVSFKF